MVVRRCRLRAGMDHFLPGLVGLIENALERLSEWHVEFDLGKDVRFAQVAKTRRRKKNNALAKLTSCCGYPEGIEFSDSSRSPFTPCHHHALGNLDPFPRLDRSNRWTHCGCGSIRFGSCKSSAHLCQSHDQRVAGHLLIASGTKNIQTVQTSRERNKDGNDRKFQDR